MILTAVSSNFIPRSVVQKTGGAARPGLESCVVCISGDNVTRALLGFASWGLLHGNPRSRAPFLPS